MFGVPTELHFTLIYIERKFPLKILKPMLNVILFKSCP
jgi:hypothetical protein